MKHKLYLPLFWKFTIAIVTIVSLFGGINLYFINYALSDLFNKEINLHAYTTAKSIAERSISPILYDDLPSLNKIVTDIYEIDSSIAYIIIVNKSKKILAHTFENGLPEGLVNIKAVYNIKVKRYIRIRDKYHPHNIIREMSVPILDGNLGYVLIGLKENSFTKSIQSINSFFLSMVALFLFFGIIGALFFSYVITFPIKKISQISENLNLESLKELKNDLGKVEIKDSSINKFKNILSTTDEIDVLSHKFYEMVMRLQSAYQELQKAQSSLLQSEKMASLGILSAGIAHEINNPITGIQNSIRRISKSPNNIKQNILYLEMMEEAVNKIEKVVAGLLNFSRKTDLKFEKISLDKIIENVLLLASFQLEKSRITIRKKYDTPDFVVSASGSRLEQVILNLVLNSIDAIDEKKMLIPSHSGKIQFQILKSNNYVSLIVSDNGTGFSGSNVSDIFNPFYTHKKIKQGTGLGLAVSYAIIEQHKGKIVAYNNANGGLSTKISLPKMENTTNG